MPKRELVREILKSISESDFSSLRELTREVSTRLRRLNRDYVISTNRCRNLSTEFFMIEAKPSSKRYHGSGCPVCGGALSAIKNRTINGSETSLGYVCRSCGYTSKGYIRAPARYRFVPKI